MFRNILETWPGCARPAQTIRGFWSLLQSFAHTCFPFRSWGQRRCVSHLEGDGGSWQHIGPDPEAGGRDSQDQRGHNRSWWVLLTGTSVNESIVSCNCYCSRIGTVSIFLTKESSLVGLAGAPEGTLQSSVVCVSVYACTCVCLLVVKAKPEMDSQMAKKNKVLFRDYCKKGKETSVWKWNQLLINMNKWVHPRSRVEGCWMEDYWEETSGIKGVSG